MNVSDSIAFLGAIMALRLTGKYTIRPAGETEKPGTLVLYFVDGELKRITGTYMENLDILLEWKNVKITKGKLSEQEVEKLKNMRTIMPQGLLRVIKERLERIRDESGTCPMIFTTIKSLLKRMKYYEHFPADSGKTLYDLLMEIDRKPTILLMNASGENIIGFIDDEGIRFMSIVGILEKEEVQKKTLLRDTSFWLFHPKEEIYEIIKGFASDGIVVSGKTIILSERELKSLVEDFSIIAFFDARSRTDIKEPLVICISKKCTGKKEEILGKEVEYAAWSGD